VTLHEGLIIPNLLLLIGGLAMMILALHYRTERHPGVMKLSPKHWRMFWNSKDWFSPEGYRLNLYGSIAIGLSGLCFLARLLL
jgi:hypothetical protein